MNAVRLRASAPAVGDLASLLAGTWVGTGTTRHWQQRPRLARDHDQHSAKTYAATLTLGATSRRTAPRADVSGSYTTGAGTTFSGHVLFRDITFTITPPASSPERANVRATTSARVVFWNATATTISISYP